MAPRTPPPAGPDRSHPAEAAALRTAHRICPLCEACCGLSLTLEGERVVAVRGQSDDVFSAGYLCPKGVALKDLHEDPDRLRTPLVRRDGVLAPATWDEAWAEIARRLPPLQAAHGRDAVAVVAGNPVSHKMGLLLVLPALLKALGTRNFFSASTLDQMPRQLVNGWMYGHWLSNAVPDIDRCDWLLVIGANPVASNGSLWTVPGVRDRLRALRRRGGQLLVVDPRRTETAALADEHLAVRPGTDVFLLLGLLHTLFDEDLVRPGRLADLMQGLEAVRAAVAPFPAERMAPRCGVPADTLRRLARSLAATPRAAVYGRMGTSVQAYGSLCAWLIELLNLLTGHVDAPGGLMFPQAAAFAANTTGAPGRGRGIVTGRHRSRVAGAPEVFGELPLGCLAEEIETPGTGQVRALVTIAANPVLSAPEGERLARAFDGLDFMLSLDLYLNETSRHADVVLPARSPLEDGHWDVAFTQFSVRNHARYSPPVLAADPAHPPEWQQLLRLAAIAQGQGAAADIDALDDALAEHALRQAQAAAEAAGTPGIDAAALRAAIGRWRGPERLLDLALRCGPWGAAARGEADGLTLERVAARPAGIDLGPLAPRLPELLRTPDGRIALAPPALVADLARVAQACATEPTDTADATHPLRLIGRRDLRSNNSWMHNLPTLAKGPDRCTLQVHPDDARRAGLADGARARLVRGDQVLEVPIEWSDAVSPGVVCLPHGWGHDLPGSRLAIAAQRPGVNLNRLADGRERDPLSGNAVLTGLPVRLERVV
ncbi:molybdopterin-dependent oxidoreductase [Piscinibacter sakaiensis]|uniref:Formate dehydrogenase-O, major subunit n=1 Tax=Piscinibacter sakaiensis TaxID=1547922 RepID=A0A0K8NW84_PISS1|nr:molybdopterin-dependent oxidoreductase [Piscinibacter sakaiensis]GAP34559.1 formate dehydrogenase-O, major subunit [Piscinibacter sakaiensis]